tara:strand:+ start:285 stop:554 length:270 start_codon:yes stop_codon:yes gene_type:complete
MIKGVFGFLKSLFFGESDQQLATDDAQSLKERTLQAVASDQHDLVHKGPRGGLYRLDANGRKIYLRQSSQAAGNPRRARRRRHNSSKAS